MKKFVKKPIVIEAVQWFKNGDHPLVQPYSNPEREGQSSCQHCGFLLDHGWIGTLEGGHIVCPGDWIIKGIKGEHYPCKPDIFEQTYDSFEENDE